MHYHTKYICLRLTILLLLAIGHSHAQTAPIHHVVLVWFPPDTTEQQIEMVMQASRRLSTIEGVASLKVGRSIKSQRPIVDDSFDIGISMQFDSIEQMQRYLQDPRHKAFVERYIKGKTSKLLVYDF
jgi:hypothetical protein